MRIIDPVVLTIFFISVLSSCKENEELNECISGCIKVQGIVKEAVSNEKLPNVSLTIGYSYVVGFNSRDENVGEVTTDQDGYFSFSLEPANEDLSRSHYYLKFDQNKYWSRHVWLEDIKLDSTIYMEVIVVPEASLDLTIRNVHPVNDQDRIIVTFYRFNRDCECTSSFSGLNGGSSSIEIEEGRYDGSNVNVTNSYVVPGDEKFYIDYVVIKNEEEEHFRDTLLIEKFENSTHLIEY